VRAKLVVTPDTAPATLAEGLAALGWQRDPDRTVTPPMLPGEPELVSWSRAGEDTRITYTFNPVVRLRVLAFSGERAAERAQEAAARLQVLGDGEIERLLASTNVREVLLGILAAENLEALVFMPRLAALCEHPERAVARAAERARKKISERLITTGISRLAELEARDPQRSALFPRIGDAALRRQILRWMVRERRPLDPKSQAVLRAGLEDADGEVRVTAMLAAARLGAHELVPVVRSVTLPETSREGFSSVERDLLRALRQLATEHLTGIDTPAKHGREEMVARLRRLVAGTYGQPDDWVSLAVHALTEPLVLEGPGPDPLPASVRAEQGGWSLARTGLSLRWVPPIPHWLGGAVDEPDEPGTVRRHTPASGFFVAMRPLSREQAHRLGAEAAAGGDADTAYRCTWEEAKQLCEALGRMEGLSVGLPSADAWEMAARGPDGRAYPWGNGAPADPEDLRSPWGVEQLAETAGEWTETLGDANLPLVCGADRRRRCAVRITAGLGDPARFAVRPVIFHSSPRSSTMANPNPLLELSSDLRLTYEIGQEHSPADPFGKTILAIEGGGRVRLDVRGAGRPPRAWEAKVAPAALAELLDALRRAGFPTGSQRVFVPDAPIARIQLERQGAQEVVQIDRYKAEKLPGYREAYAILDSLAFQLSGGETAPVRGTAPVQGAITEVKKLVLN
jgi:hypothetical protein